MTLTQLRYFCLACEDKSITKAAEHFYVSQPAVSSAIRELEKEFGLQLLERRYKGFDLTQNGRLFYEKASRLLQEADRFSQEAHELARRDRFVTLGLTRSTGSATYAQFFPWYLQEEQEQGGTEIRTIPGGSRDLFQMMLEERLDMAIMPTEALQPSDQLNSRVLRFQRMVFAVSEKNHLAKESFVTVPMVCDEKLVGTLDDYLRTRRLTEIFAEYGKEPNIVKRYDQLTNVIHAVQANVAVAFMPEDLVERYRGIIPLPLKGLPQIGISLVWSKKSYERETVRRFVKSVIRFFEEEGAG